MTDSPDYTPPKSGAGTKENCGRFANINLPIVGSAHNKNLPFGHHPLQLYSLATPNGVKVTIMLELLLALGHHGSEYDAWLIRIDEVINSAATSWRRTRSARTAEPRHRAAERGDERTRRPGQAVPPRRYACLCAAFRQDRG